MTGSGDVSGMRVSIEDSARCIGSLIGHVPAIERAADMLVSVLRLGGKVLTAGNGGSASEALHMAEELVGRFRSNRRSLPSTCLAADPTALTCIANDFGYDRVFSRQIEGLGTKGDLLVLFSTSGSARNLKLAAEAARGGGLFVIALLGRDGGALAGLADVEIIVAGDKTERIQEAHQVLLHLMLDAVENAFPAEGGE
ncbi:MAG: SIS domain-containing protein [Lentisphaerae bacterium]|nr:SIS domain-containing protein [Lentisphaerota bacterium]